jgi:hypothetical protein
MMMMMKTLSPQLTLYLALAVLWSSDASAGHWGLFPRWHARSNRCCVQQCPVHTVNSSAAETRVATAEHPIKLLCYVKATVVGMKMGYTCTAASDWSSNEDCEVAKANAATQARQRAANSGCMEQRIVFDCVPQFCPCCQTNVTERATGAGGSNFRVTYTIVCCSGYTFSYSVTDANLAVAKLRAKDAAFFQASLECSSGIRSYCWKACRVPDTGPCEAGH